MLARFRASSDVQEGIRAAGVPDPVPEPARSSRGTSLRWLCETYVRRVAG